MDSEKRIPPMLNREGLNMAAQAEHGKVNISDQVIAKIASTAIQNNHAVAALVEGRTKRTDKHKFYKAVGIRIKGLEVSIDIHSVVRLGTPLHQMSRALQLAVKQAVEHMTGLIVSEVNIEIVGVQLSE
jgi:uncharacterized alkaline shock family protein YloU